MYFRNPWQQCTKSNHSSMLALPVLWGGRLMKWCLSAFEGCRRLSTHITKFAEGKVNKLCPAAGTQQRNQILLRLSLQLQVSHQESSVLRGSLFSLQKVPPHPERIILWGLSLWLFFFKAGTFTMTSSAFCQYSSLSVELCYISMLRSGPGCHDLQKHTTTLFTVHIRREFVLIIIPKTAIYMHIK